MSDLPQVRFASSPLVVLAAALASGILSGHFIASGSARLLAISSVIGAVLTLLSGWLVSKDRLSLAVSLVIAALFCAGVVLSLLEGRSIKPNRIARLFDEGVIAAGDPVELTGIIEGQPEPAPQSMYLTLRVERLSFKGSQRAASGTVLLLAHLGEQRVKLEYDALELRHGARISVIAALDREENFRNPGASDFTEYLERKGFDATGVIKSPLLIERLDDERVFLPLALLYEWREHLEREFAARFSPETGGVLDAALLGNRYNVSRTSAERFRAGGTFHILVIAGLHISFIAGMAFLVVRWFTRKRLWQFFFAAVFLWMYTIAVGAHAPVVRAALMFTIVVFGPVVWRRANSLNAIGGAALGLLIWRPGDLFEPSFQLTILSVLAIVSLAVPVLRKMEQVGSWRPALDTPYPPMSPDWFRIISEALFWSEREWRAEVARSNVKYRLFKTPIAAGLEHWHLQKLCRFACAAAVVSASVQVGMLPALVVYFHRLSLASLVLNIFVGGLMAILAFVALAVVIVAQLSTSLAVPLVLLAEKINWLMIHSVDPFSRLGIASMRLPHYTGWAAGLYVLYYLPLGFLVLALARWKPLRAPSTKAFAGGIFFPKTVALATMALATLFTLVVLHPFSAPRPDGQLHVDFLDVGQGDSALLTMPDGTTMLVDGGGTPGFGAGNAGESEDEPFERDTRSIGEGVVSEFLWARGLDRVDYILATHADADHIDGLNDVARNFKVRGAIVARTPLADLEYARFSATMKEAGVPIEKIGAGDTMHFGNLTARVLWPNPSSEEDAPSRNNDSIVLLLRSGERTILLTGDIEKEGEAAVLKEELDLRSDVVKVGHHGSKTSSTESFVSATLPSLAIISVGRHSVFGHPHKDVVERWRARGAEVVTTGEKGTITVVTDGRTLSLSTFCTGVNRVVDK